jgi:hypothetical protein
VNLNNNKTVSYLVQHFIQYEEHFYVLVDVLRFLFHFVLFCVRIFVVETKTSKQFLLQKIRNNNQAEDIEKFIRRALNNI